MAWKFPLKRWKDGDVVDLEAVNESFLAFAEESAGRLNEHNWSDTLATALDAIDDLEEDVAWRIASSSNTCDVGGPTPYSNALFELPLSETWTPVRNTIKTIYTDGGPLYILFTGQFIQLEADPNKYSYAMFGVEVDGALVTESVVGALDTTASGEGAEFGISGDCFGFDTEVVVPLSPGLHTIRGVACLKNYTYSRLDEPKTDELGAAIGHRELVLWELAR